MGIIKKLFGRKGGDGETTEFKTLLDGCMEGLRLQVEAHQGSWRFGEEDRWDFSKSSGELVFTFPEIVVRTSAQIIGSFDSREGRWLWGWANTTIPDSLTRDSVRVREYGEQHQIRRLTTPKWSGEEMDGWHMAALANHLCESNGCYRGPSDKTYIFFTLGVVQMTKRT